MSLILVITLAAVAVAGAPPAVRLLDRKAGWPLAALLDNPCFSNTDVNPNAAGALWIMIATKMISPSFIFDVVADAPIAMPSAAA